MHTFAEKLLIYDLIKSMMLLNSEIRAWTMFWVCTIMTFRGSVIALILTQTGYANTCSSVVFTFLMVRFIYSFVCILYHKTKMLTGLEKSNQSILILCYVESKKRCRSLRIQNDRHGPELLINLLEVL